MELRQPNGKFRKQNILYMIFRCLLKMILRHLLVLRIPTTSQVKDTKNQMCSYFLFFLNNIVSGIILSSSALSRLSSASINNLSVNQ